jgi:2-polyprenyl-3-methyl-5-hydroxy-6-metoxy-1,4-benzoquinol methylase
MKIDFKKMRYKGFNTFVNKGLEKLSIKVKEGSGYSLVKKCLLCNSSKFESYYTKFKIPIVRCTKCSLIFSKKKPNNFNDLYSGDEYLKFNLKSYQKSRTYRKNRFGKERVKILQSFKKKGKLLDVGCGNGWFLEAAKKHYNQCAGVEFSNSLRTWLEKNLKIKTYKEISDVKDNTYDIITAFDLIEHVPDPKNFLKLMKSKLTKDGIILIYTPNVESLGFDFLKEKNNLLCPPSHLTYFSKKTFSRLSKECGLKILYSECRGLDVGDIYGLLNSNKKDKDTANFLEKNSVVLQDFLDKIGYSNHARYILS